MKSRNWDINPSAASRHLPQGGDNSLTFSLIALKKRGFFPRGGK